MLARWSGWGAVPEVFDNRSAEFAWARDKLAALLSAAELATARRNTLNAHYTDPAIVAAIWDAVRRRVLRRPRAGAWLRLRELHRPRPAGPGMIGVEPDPTTAAIAAAALPVGRDPQRGFEATRVPRKQLRPASATCRSGNVVSRPRHNPAEHSIHNHFIIKALALTGPAASSPC